MECSHCPLNGGVIDVKCMHPMDVERTLSSKLCPLGVAVNKVLQGHEDTIDSHLVGVDQSSEVTIRILYYEIGRVSEQQIARETERWAKYSNALLRTELGDALTCLGS